MTKRSPGSRPREQPISFALPANLIGRLGWAPEELARRARQWFVIGLFCEAEISGGKAAELLGFSGLVEFRDLLARYHIPHTVVTREEFEHDLRVLEEHRAERARGSSPTPDR
jgi:predicted HTH domain antitoxin